MSQETCLLRESFEGRFLHRSPRPFLAGRVFCSQSFLCLLPCESLHSMPPPACGGNQRGSIVVWAVMVRTMTAMRVGLRCANPTYDLLGDISPLQGLRFAEVSLPRALPWATLRYPFRVQAPMLGYAALSQPTRRSPKGAKQSSLGQRPRTQRYQHIVLSGVLT